MPAISICVWSISIPRFCFVDLKCRSECFHHIISKQALVDQILPISFELTASFCQM